MHAVTASTHSLWFHIEAAFREIVDACVNARAAQLALEQRSEEANLLRTGRPSRTSAVLNEEVGKTRGTFAKASELARDLAFREANAQGPDLVEVRSQLRKRLAALKAQSAEVLAGHDIYYALFPLVVYVDELVQAATRGGTARWEPLQSELYEVDNGGELFYSILDERLRQQETHPLVLEVFYFCLADGFVGMYQGDTRKVEEYMQRLMQRIPQREIAAPGATAEHSVELVAFPWKYYAMARGAVVATHSILSWLGASST
ncbi:MAG: DotU family type IV/VI secretion system protein [Myxococcales bacterium]